MIVDVNNIKIAFAKERYYNLLEEHYLVETCSKDNKSSYSREERNLDRFIQIEFIYKEIAKC